MHTVLLRVTNALLFVSFLLQLGSGLAHSGLRHWQFELLHERNGLLLSGLICVHLYLNRKWIRAQLRQAFKTNRQ